MESPGLAPGRAMLQALPGPLPNPLEAVCGNRTHVSSLARSRSAPELRPRVGGPRPSMETPGVAPGTRPCGGRVILFHHVPRIWLSAIRREGVAPPGWFAHPFYRRLRPSTGLTAGIPLPGLAPGTRGSKPRMIAASPQGRGDRYPHLDSHQDLHLRRVTPYLLGHGGRKEEGSPEGCTRAFRSSAGCSSD